MTITTDRTEPLHFQLAQPPVRTDRIDEMLAYVQSCNAGVCIERARYYTESYRETKAEPEIIRRAKALAHTLDNISMYVLPGSLLLGNQASRPNRSPLFPEFTIDFLQDEIVNGNPYFPPERPADKFEIDEEILPELQDIIHFWEGQTHRERVYARLPKEALMAQYQVGAVNILNYTSGGDGHFAPPYAWIAERGLTHFVDYAKRALGEIDPTDYERRSSREFYQSVVITCEAVIAWANRYADHVERLAGDESDARRRDELLALAAIARHVPAKPARTFHEALQLVTFIQYAIQIEDNAQGVCFGRFDQMMYPYYERDVAAGILDREHALELIQNFLVMFSVIERIRSWDDTEFFRGKPIFQNVVIGGIDPDTGADATNEVSYLVLDAIQNTRTVQPAHYVRWHRDAPEAFKMKVAETIRLGTGFPAVANDEAYIKTMLNRGYSYRDAADYGIIGCAEPGPAGLRGGRTGAAWYSLVKCMELALYNGRDPKSGLQLTANPSGHDLSTFANWDEVWEAFVHQAIYYLKLHVVMDNVIDEMYEAYIDEPFGGLMCCPETTLERGKSIKQGGAKYDFTGNQTIGLANVANSLYAVKKLVFVDKILSGEQLLQAMQTNFEDVTTTPTGPEIRRICLNVPKYGNDSDEVDYIARDALALVCTELPKYKNTRYGRGPIGGFFQASTTTVSSNTPFGRAVGALPDGRLAGQPCSDGQSPFRGTDTLGPTAAVSSVSKLNLVLLSEGSLYNMKLLPQDLKS
ncbi:MAG: glycyl radical protein [Propionibacteriaceae bacterium]